MTTKLFLGACCAVSITFLACNNNSSEEKKSDISATNPVTSAPAAPAEQPVPAQLLEMEKKFAADTNDYQMRLMLANNYYSLNMLPKAEQHFLKVYEHDNRNMIALTNLGNLYYDTKQDEKAIAFYEKALEIDKNNVNMRCDLATCYLNINKQKKAIKILRENIALDPKHEKSHYNLSVMLKQNGDLKEADEQMKIFEQLKANRK